MLKKIILACVTVVFYACASSGGAGINREPDWVRDPYTKYNKQTNVAALGSGNSREAAEKSALGNLVAIFGQNIQIDEKVSSYFQQAVNNGVAANWSEDLAIDTAITTSAGMDSLVGAEIAEAWHDGKNLYYAVAVLNKAKAIQIYSGMINSNQTTINKLINVPAIEKNTLNGLARYQFAATLADMTAPYVNLLSVIGGPVPAFKRGDSYRLEALEIAKEIPVGLRVRNDKAGRIQGAFAKALSDFGLGSGGSGSRYILDVDITTTPIELPANTNKFTRIELKADLKDTISETILLPFGFNSREGHITIAEAENRAYAAAERKINEEYARFLNNYLSQLLFEK